MPAQPQHFRRDVLWNVASLAVLGVSGIALNALIGLYYDAAALGIFNQVLAAYIFFSQAAVGGIHYSLLKEIAPAQSDRARVADLLWSALLPTVLLSGSVSLLFYLSGDLFAVWLESPEVARGMALAAPGLFFFALNKVLLSALNGLQHMRAFALFQMLRYLLILAALGMALLWRFPAADISYVWSASEGLLFVVLLLVCLPHLRGGRARPALTRQHLNFGWRSAWSGMLLELNARVDVLMLGRLSGDTVVGIYSFAAMLAEGCYQLLIVLQNNYNPLLAKELAAGRMQALAELIARARRRIYPAALALGALAVLLYPVALQLLSNKAEFASSLSVFALLVAGIVAASGDLPFQPILMLGGYPLSHSLLLLLSVGANVLGNAVLIPHWGANGAATATALAMVMSCVLLRLMARQKLQLRI